MVPVLYKTITEGTVPTHYGIGALVDCLSCEVTEQRNGSYELAMVYTAKGIHAEDIKVNSFIKAKPNFMDEPQLFRIYKVGKVMNGRFTVSARHISYDLSGKVITGGSASSCVAACALLSSSAGNFIISTDKELAGAFSVSQPSSVRSWFGGKQGSILDVFGPGEWKYDNYTARFMAHRGDNRGVTIRYGKNLTELRQRVGMVFQSYELFPHLNVLDNILLAPTKVQKRKREEVKEEAMALLARIGLESKAESFPRQLSGGQKQRVAIIRALCMHPEVMLFDEVTAALDPEMVREVLDVILELANQGKTMLIVTHEMQFARAIADRVIFLNEGGICEEGPPEQFFDHPRTERARQFLQTFTFSRKKS